MEWDKIGECCGVYGFNPFFFILQVCFIFFHFLSFVLSLKVYVNIQAWVEVVAPSFTLYLMTIVQRLELNWINSKHILYTQIVGLSRGCREPIIHAWNFGLSQVHRELILLTSKVFFYPYKLVFSSPHPHTYYVSFIGVEGGGIITSLFTFHPPPQSISPSSTLGPNYSPFSTPLFYWLPHSTFLQDKGWRHPLYSHPFISFVLCSIHLFL